MKILMNAMLTFLMLFVVINCTKKVPEPANEAQEESEWTSEFIDHHNARNSLDYYGTYRGILPSASGEGIETTIVLAEDNIFFRKSEYLGKEGNSTFEEAGSFVWNEAGNTITLEAIDDQSSYFVGENVLFHLDQEGRIISGDLAENYKLRKIE